MTHLGFDHHKRATQAVAMDEQGSVLRERRVENSEEALKAFLSGLPKPWRGVVEAGPNWGWIYDTLTRLGVEMIVAHPRKLKAIADAKIKNDEIDARMLAHLLRSNLIPSVYVPSRDVREQKMLWRERTWLVRLNVRLKNRIHQLLDRHHVAVPAVSDLFGAKGREFLKVLPLPPAARRVLDIHLKLLETHREEIARVQRLASEATAAHPLRAYLESLPGFGAVFAPIVALEIDDVGRFRNAGKLESYCGLVPTLDRSAWKGHHGGVGRECNHWLKWAFVEAAWVAIRRSPYFASYYQRLRKGKSAQVAITACARRLCEVAYLLMTQRRFYEERPAVSCV